MIPNHVCIDSVFEITQHNRVNTDHSSSQSLILFQHVCLFEDSLIWVSQIKHSQKRNQLGHLLMCFQEKTCKLLCYNKLKYQLRWSMLTALTLHLVDKEKRDSSGIFRTSWQWSLSAEAEYIDGPKGPLSITLPLHFSKNTLEKGTDTETQITFLLFVLFFPFRKRETYLCFRINIEYIPSKIIHTLQG